MSVTDTSRDFSIPLMDRQKPCHCGKPAVFQSYCGAWVCESEHHVGLARCYCGWSASGGDGYAELEEMGERIEPEDC